jgi:hypothetical protein
MSNRLRRRLSFGQESARFIVVGIITGSSSHRVSHKNFTFGRECPAARLALRVLARGAARLASSALISRRLCETRWSRATRAQPARYGTKSGSESRPDSAGREVFAGQYAPVYQFPPRFAEFLAGGRRLEARHKTTEKTLASDLRPPAPGPQPSSSAPRRASGRPEPSGSAPPPSDECVPHVSPSCTARRHTSHRAANESLRHRWRPGSLRRECASTGYRR